MVLLIAWLMGNSLRLARRDIGAALVAGLLNITGWLYSTALGLTMLPAGRATVLAYTMPLWALMKMEEDGTLQFPLCRRIWNPIKYGSLFR